MSAEQLVAFVLANRGSTNAFKNMTESNILNDIKSSMDDQCFLCVVQPDMGITGIVTGEVNHEFGRIFVHNMLCTTATAVESICKFLIMFYGHYKLQALRDGSNDLSHITTYKNAKQLLTRLIRMSYKKQQLSRQETVWVS